MEKISSFIDRNNGENTNENDGSNEPEVANVDSKCETIDLKSEAGEIEERERVDESFSVKIEISLSQVSEEIDCFINTLSEAKNPKWDSQEVPESVEIFLKQVESIIEKYESGESSTTFGQTQDDDLVFVEALSRVSKLTNALGEFPSGSETSSSLNRTSTVLHRAMSLLEEEFRTLLQDSRTDQKSLKTKQSSFNKPENHDQADHCILPEPETAERDERFPAYSPESVSDMNRLATAMISSGYETECCQVYTIARRGAFKEAFKKLGFDTISIDDVQKMPWESLEGGIATWINVTKQCATVLFPRERKLSDSIFSYYPSISHAQFGNLARVVLMQLLNFSDAVAMTKRSAEKLFKFLDMYEALRDLIPAIDGVDSEDLKSEIFAAASHLGEAVVCIFCELENSIKSDTGKQPVPSGAIHPLTRYTMNYLKYACDDYKDTLEEAFQQHRRVDSTESESEQNPHSHDHKAGPNSPFAEELMTIMDLLDINLESKSKLYRDPSLRSIFLMNNGRYILQKIKGSTKIHQIVGDTWCRKRSSELRQYHKNYQRETWGKLLGCLSPEGLQVNGKVSKPVLKEKLKSFNARFDEIHKTQRTWVVSDEQLQSELRVSVSAVMIPAYRSFLGRFSQYLDSGRQTEKYVKYQPEDIETLVEELFDGNPASMGRRRT